MGKKKCVKTMAQAQLIVQPTVYKGTEGDDFSLWLEQFERCATANEWSTAKQYIVLPALLQDAASVTYKSVLELKKPTDYDTLKAALLSAFCPEATRRRYYNQFKKLKYSIGDNPYHYGAELVRLYKAANPDITAESAIQRQCVNQFIEGLPTHWQEKFYQSEVSTIAGLVEKVNVMTVSKESVQSNVLKTGHTNRRQSQKCYKCQLFGHTAADCHTKCRSCGKVGHISRNCYSHQSHQPSPANRGGGQPRFQRGSRGGGRGSGPHWQSRDRQPVQSAPSHTSAGGSGGQQMDHHGQPRDQPSSSGSRRVNQAERSLVLSLDISGNTVYGIIDSGSEKTLLSKNVARKCGLQIFENSETITTANRNVQLSVCGTADVICRVAGQHDVAVHAIVCDDISDDMLLGMDFLAKAKVLINFAESSVSVFGKNVPVFNPRVVISSHVVVDSSSEVVPATVKRGFVTRRFSVCRDVKVEKQEKCVKNVHDIRSAYDVSDNNVNVSVKSNVDVLNTGDVEDEEEVGEKVSLKCTDGQNYLSVEKLEKLLKNIHVGRMSLIQRLQFFKLLSRYHYVFSYSKLLVDGMAC